MTEKSEDTNIQGCHSNICNVLITCCNDITDILISNNLLKQTAFKIGQNWGVVEMYRRNGLAASRHAVEISV
jgi:hypothetical protein